MGKRKNVILSMIFVGALAASAAAQTQQTADQTQPRGGDQASMAPVTNANQAVDRIIAREHDEIATIRRYSPIIETYIQDMKPDKDMGAIPVKDHYFLGQADLSKGVVDNSMISGNKKGKLDELNPIAHLGGYFTSSYVPEGFLQMIYIDMNGLDRAHYQFDYVRREFLGDVRCVVFDVTPLPHSGKGRFKGRLWAEDQNYTIVRFNGVYTPIAGINGFNLHFDSWRENMAPGLWLPAFVFSQESDLKDFLGNHVRFKSQTRLWGYDLKAASHQEEFSELTIESPNAVQDQAGAAEQDRSPIEAEREWQHQAEVNVLDRLQRTGLLAPPGEIDKVLETVVNNLEVTNNLDIQPEVHCRVLLTGTLESFSIGHTIVLSRGLLDVLPDEASLATMLAQELANIIVTKPSTDQWGFNDTTNVSTVEALDHFSFRDSPDQVQTAGQKAVELLKNSPYKDKLGNAGLFLKQLDAESKSLTALINPHLGNRVFVYDQLINSAPQLQPDKIDQISALPIGARVKLDPWNDHVELLKAKPVPLLSAREKMPFGVTPFMPYLTRYQKPSSAIAADPAKADVAKQQQEQAEQPR
ncbi:MAG TPA: hypothetical protein VG322_02515 [Candidatus Acidoferrales bacterium]|jgi:hypothetical protein|nr:hypothetical protein [Candidatus Acidoferrales bacterium]